MVSLAITPENLPVIAAKLGVAESTLSSVMSASQAASAPMPPGSDDASIFLAQRFCAYQATFFPPTAQAVSNWQQGSEMLVPVSTDYDGADGHGGATVGLSSSLFGQ